MSVYYAHSRNKAGKRQGLPEHLRAVANEARAAADAFGAGDVAYYLGLWHDVGKFNPEFQRYLRDAEAAPQIKRRGPDHKAAGARLAQEQRAGALMLALQGHHGGLRNRADLRQWFGQKRAATDEAIAAALQAVPDLLPPGPLVLPSQVSEARSAEFYVRMLFSALVDADFLDTEQHFAPDTALKRGAAADVETLWQRMEKSRAQFAQVAATPVNQARAEIYNACIRSATLPPGVFRLAVPTGGGKTHSGMAFALRHALAHGLRRVVVAVPYLTITQQTAEVYQDIFNDPADATPVLLEHHGGVHPDGESDEYDPAEVWRRLTAENWDAPLIVTTTVQLFESIFAKSTSRCRKLHRLARSVIILDEAQTLPPRLLDPILDALAELTSHYGATVIFSTATQPAFEALPIFERVAVRDIVPQPERFFRTLKRVTYDWRQHTPVSWEEVAGWLRAEEQALCIVNTKQNALDLLRALGDPNALHLSTLLCGAHRKQVIAEVKRRLVTGEPCRLVATQVVEAGVDLDFPIVFRAMGPLDSIIQAAGRANREGRLAEGRVVIFKPAEGGLPGGEYKRATAIAGIVLGRSTDLDDPATATDYFRALYKVENTDGAKIQGSRAQLDYLQTAQDFRMIDDETISVLVKCGDAKTQAIIEQAWQEIEQRTGNLRLLMRQVQPYTVSLYAGQARRYEQKGWLVMSRAAPGFGLWLGRYDPVTGLRGDDMPADSWIF